MTQQHNWPTTVDQTACTPIATLSHEGATIHAYVTDSGGHLVCVHGRLSSLAAEKAIPAIANFVRSALDEGVEAKVWFDPAIPCQQFYDHWTTVQKRILQAA